MESDGEGRRLMRREEDGCGGREMDVEGGRSIGTQPPQFETEEIYIIGQHDCPWSAGLLASMLN